MQARQLIQQTISTKNFEDAFYVVDIEDIIEKHKRWSSKMPRIKPFYAVKCNDASIVLETVAALGLGFDCASKTEIEAVLSTGVSPKNIIYAQTCKSKSHIEFALKANVDLMTFDNEEELYKIADCAPNARLVVRIRLGDDSLFERKFGTVVKEVPNLLHVAKHLELNVVGVSFHVGSASRSSRSCKPFIDAIKDAAQVFEIAKDIGFAMTILDIGGGFLGTSDKKDILFFDDIARMVNNSIDELFPPEMNVEIIAEPGRYYVTSAFTLSTMIIAKRKDIINDETVIMYYINDGRYGSFSKYMFGENDALPIPQIKDNETRKRSAYQSVIWGPTSDKSDCVRTKVMLPEMNVGEWMTFEEIGAYTMAMGTKFNGFQTPLLKYYASAIAVEYLKKSTSSRNLFKLLGLDDSISTIAY